MMPLAMMAPMADFRSQRFYPALLLLSMCLCQSSDCYGHILDENLGNSDKVSKSSGSTPELRMDVSVSMTTQLVNISINNFSTTFGEGLLKATTIGAHESNDDCGNVSRMSIANMTCGFFEQPLNHFLPRGKSPTYQERYCVYDGNGNGALQGDNGDPTGPKSPIFFYTGNESPVEQYINQV